MLVWWLPDPEQKCTGSPSQQMSSETRMSQSLDSLLVAARSPTSGRNPKGQQQLDGALSDHLSGRRAGKGQILATSRHIKCLHTTHELLMITHQATSNWHSVPGWQVPSGSVGPTGVSPAKRRHVGLAAKCAPPIKQCDCCPDVGSWLSCQASRRNLICALCLIC